MGKFCLTLKWPGGIIWVHNFDMRARCDQISRGQDSGKFKTTFVCDSSAIITDLWKLQCFMVSTFFTFTCVHVGSQFLYFLCWLARVKSTLIFWLWITLHVFHLAATGSSWYYWRCKRWERSRSSGKYFSFWHLDDFMSTSSLRILHWICIVAQSLQ